MSNSRRRIRQYVGLALVICIYLGGIVGWSWAVSTVEPTPPDAPRTTASPDDAGAP